MYSLTKVFKYAGKKAANSDEPAGVAKITGSRPDTLKTKYPLVIILL